MKKKFSEPSIQLIYLDEIDVVATSGDEVKLSTQGEEYDARGRGSSIWDD